MSNTLLTVGMISKEALMVLKNNIRFARFATRRYEKYLGQAGLKAGDTISIRKPPRYSVTTGAGIGLQDSTETKVDLQVQQYNIGLPFTTAELTLSIDEYSKRFLEPAMAAMANKMDIGGLQTLAEATYHSVGTPATTATTYKTWHQAKAKILHAGAPQDGKITAFLGPDEEVEVVSDLKGVFHPSTRIAMQNLDGAMGRYGGMDWVMDQNVYRYTTGALGGTPLVNGASQTGASIITDGWTASVTGVVKKGDVLTFADVFEVNPQSRQSTGQLAQFVVTADANSDGSGNATISISPSMTVSGNFQNISGSPANNAVIKIFGHASDYAAKSTNNSLVFHESAICLANIDLDLPRGNVEASRATDPDSGLSLRVVYYYDGDNDREICRLDGLWGWVASYPEMACRVQG